MKIPGGAYSRLIHLHETHREAENVHPDTNVTNNLGSISIDSKPRSQSISRRSTSKSFSFGHSIPAPLGSPDPREISDALDIVEEATDKVTSTQKKASIGRLFHLNKPETFVLVLGSITAVMHGIIFPLYGILISIAIKMFYEPPEELLKDSRFWASMFAVLGACTFVLIPIEYFLFGLAGGKLVERIRSMTFQSIMCQEINWFDKPEHSRCVFNLFPHFEVGKKNLSCCIKKYPLILLFRDLQL